ncbi:MAG: hypothetical protein ACD_61C00148G0003 [uncultured bacterium]|nr:MAG: hypothetical protein ACD_61C00148G0003 [uncultured bacterium]
MKITHLIPVLAMALLLSGCGPKKTTDTKTNKNQPLTTKLLVNELALKDRPFTVLVPHATNRLFTFVTVGADKAQSASLDIEYQSGDLLKGARTSIDSPIASPFIKAIILGSCSTGGKCTFDKDLKSGTSKLKLTFAGQDVTHVLKGDFVFLTGQKNLPDGKVVFEPSKLTAKENLIMLNSFGLPKPTDKEILLYPVVFSSTNAKAISGTLTFNQSGVTSAAIYDGSVYQPLKISQKDNTVTIVLNQKPWSMNAEITRDDEKGSKESLTLYLLGPIVLYK